MNAVAVEKFKSFEWLTHGLTASSPSIEPVVRGTGEKPLNYQDRLGAIASMDTQLEKAVTSVIIFGQQSKGDFDYILNHLERIMIVGAQEDKRLKPKSIKIEDLARKVAWMVVMFALNPEMEGNFTAKGRLRLAAGIKEFEMTLKAYDGTWKQYEKLMCLAIESAIDAASKAVEKYKRNTYKDA
ncbi:hypothetical protein [Acinetobacter soli]|uniref:hypothetical protein n=1 Tax=Acinetobacter soli TaxID=487316 RepID=UPI00124FBB5D|nr:hypothetical protein [Acinetobacter soli]